MNKITKLIIFFIIGASILLTGCTTTTQDTTATPEVENQENQTQSQDPINETFEEVDEEENDDVEIGELI